MTSGSAISVAQKDTLSDSATACHSCGPSQPIALLRQHGKAVVPENGPRQDYVRAVLDRTGVEAFPKQDSSMLAVLVRANALIVRPPAAPAAPAGTPVQVLPLDF